MTRMFSAAIAATIILTLLGCGSTPQEVAATVDQAVARAVAEERLAAEARLKEAIEQAEAKTLAGSLQQSNRSAEQARKEGFDAGKLAGRAAAQAESELKIEATRKDAYALGREAGEAAAAGPNFERGIAVGVQQGRLEGAEAAKAKQDAIVAKEVQLAVDAATKAAFADGFDQGETKAAIRQLANQNIPWMLLTTAMIVAAFYVLSKRDRFAAQRAEGLRELDAVHSKTRAVADRDFTLKLIEAIGSDDPVSNPRLTDMGGR